MTLAKQIYVSAIILYTVLAFIGSKFTQLSIIDLFMSLMLSCILFQLLDWKYGEEEGK